MQARLKALVDRQDISDALIRFARGMDRFDRDLFLSAFHEDAVIDAGPYVGGAAGLYDWASGLHEAGQFATQHNLLNQTVDLDGDSAHVETYYLFAGRNRDESVWVAGGRYINRFDKRDDQWRIAMHCNAIEWSSVLQGAGNPFAGLPDLLVNGEARRDAQDLSYRRPLTNLRAEQTPPAQS